MASPITQPKSALGESRLFASTYLYRVANGRSSGAQRTRSLATPLMLTALVDAFSILVIFLLVQFSPEPNEFEVDGQLRLPVSESAETKEGSTFALIRFEAGGLVFENQKYGSSQQLISVLKVKSPSRLILAADGIMSFDSVGKVMAELAGQGPWTVEIAVEKAESSEGPNDSAKPSQTVELAGMSGRSDGDRGQATRGRP